MEWAAEGGYFSYPVFNARTSPPRGPPALEARGVPAPCGTLPGARVLRVQRGRVEWSLFSHLLRPIFPWNTVP